MTAPAITGGAEGKLQRPQWQPGQPPRRRIRFCYCTTIEWHNTRLSHVDWRIYAPMNYVNIDLDNGLSPKQRQASIQSRAETSIISQNIKFSFKKIHSKMSSAAECRPFCFGAYEIRYQGGTTGCHNYKVPQAITPSHRQPPPQSVIHRSNINHSKRIHMWHEHIGPGHDLIKDSKSCSDCAAFMFMGSMFQTCAP